MSLPKTSSLEKGLLFYDSLLCEEWQSSESLGTLIGVDQRTIKKYASLLRDYGWPVLSAKGKGKGYKLGEICPDTLRLTSRDLFTLAILLAQGSSMLPSAEATKLKSKLKALLPNAARQRVSNLEELVSVQGFEPKDWDLVEHIGTGLSDRRYSLLLDYQGSSDAEIQRRHVLPIRIRSKNAVWYLDLFDLVKSKARSFRFDRIRRAVLLKQECYHPEPEAEEFTDHKWDFGSGEAIQVAIEVTESLANWLGENPEHHSQRIKILGTRIHVTYEIRRVELFADWVMSLRGARIVGPEILKKIVRTRATSWLSDQGTLGVSWER